ncbi:MAG TPA: glycoside hydrolase family 2 TIM barrel-domain containing protein [Gemmatimonadales bacterium]|nr:glycoside hydrolase family 2 TIM barrel-domain containing protein [Gemmatimonadales bacterium]
MLALLLVLLAQRQTVSFDHAWRFHLGDVAGAQQPAFDDAGWRTLDVPHDWSIEGEFSEQNPAGVAGGALPGGVGWYRKVFSIPAADRGKLVFVEFDGVYRNSEVWINGQSLGKRPYGYSSFRYELTPHLRDGSDRNVIAVRVDNSQQPNSRWYSGSGIYRHVRLVTTDPVHVDHWGTYVTTPAVTGESARVTIRTSIRNSRHVEQPIVLRTVVYDSTGKEIAAVSTAGRAPGDTVTEIAQDLTIARPGLWSLERPYLYRAVSRVMCGSRACDSYTTPFGVRSFVVKADSGFFLNGRPVKIRGVCLHHDLGALGAALNTRAIERQLEIMRAMGANALRTSHNPPAPELLDLTDRMGFIVMDEAFDMWRKKKTDYDYHLDFDAWHERDLSDMVRRDRNHPSVFIWSIGNEVMEQWTDGDSTAAPIARELAGVVRRLDPTRPITSANNNGSSGNPLFHAGALDLLGHNYHHAAWPNFPTQFAGAKFIITEAMSALNSRGVYEQPSDSVAIYYTPYEKNRGPQPPQNGRISSYDNRHAFWGSLHEESLRLFEQNTFLSGMFIWQGIDYLGEPTPYEWPARSSYFGVVDLAGFPKDPFYLYQSVWTERPMLHLLPHWNWAANDTIDVWAYTNADDAELFLNGASLGVKRKTEPVSHLMWRVAYAPGTLRGVARTAGRVTATTEVKTASAPARIALAPDRARIRADGEDLSYVTVTVQDRAGVEVPTAEPLIRFQVTGDARIVGVDNGDQMSHTSLQANQIRLFNGKALVIIRAGTRRGAATLTAEAEGLAPATVRIELR